MAPGRDGSKSSGSGTQRLSSKQAPKAGGHASCLMFVPGAQQHSARADAGMRGAASNRQHDVASVAQGTVVSLQIARTQ